MTILCVTAVMQQRALCSNRRSDQQGESLLRIWLVSFSSTFFFQRSVCCCYLGKERGSSAWLAGVSRSQTSQSAGKTWTSEALSSQRLLFFIPFKHNNGNELGYTFSTAIYSLSVPVPTSELNQLSALSACAAVVSLLAPQ